MSFVQAVSANQNIRQESAIFLPIVDSIQNRRQEIAKSNNAINYLPLPGLKILRNHLADIQEGKTDQPVNINEFLALQNELHQIRSFVNDTQTLGLLTGNHQNSGLVEDFRNVGVQYAAMIDALVDSRALFSSHQPSPSRTLT